MLLATARSASPRNTTDKRDHAILGQDGEIGADLEETAPADRLAHAIDPDQLPRCRGGGIGPGIDHDLALGRDGDEKIVHAVAGVHRPGAHGHDIAAALQLRAEREHAAAPATLSVARYHSVVEPDGTNHSRFLCAVRLMKVFTAPDVPVIEAVRLTHDEPS